MHIKYTFSWVLPAAALLLAGAGCSSSDPVPRPPAPASPYLAPTSPLLGTDPSSKVPDDVPVYPGGTVIAVSGNVHVAQLTPDKGEQVITWIKAEYARRGAAFKKTSQEGFSTNLVFESADKRYNVRVDQPRDGGSAFLTISREPKDAVMGE